MLVKRYEGHMNIVSSLTLIDKMSAEEEMATASMKSQDKIEISQTTTKSGRVIKRATVQPVVTTAASSSPTTDNSNAPK